MRTIQEVANKINRNSKTSDVTINHDDTITFFIGIVCYKAARDPKDKTKNLFNVFRVDYVSYSLDPRYKLTKIIV